MTELEALTQDAAQVLSIPQYNFDTFSETLKDAFALGRASARTPAQVASWEQNRRRIGGKPGRKDKKPRHRRTRAELEAIQDKGETK